MASTAEHPERRAAQPARKRSSEPFIGGAAIALIALAATGIGFYRTFFSRLGETDLGHMLHGMTSTGWLVLVLIQALLIRQKSYRLHRVLGWSSVVLFTGLIVTSWWMMALMLSGKSGLPFDFAKFFGFSDILDTPLLLILYGGAIALRKDRHVHSRLIVTTVLVGIIPALARMFNLVITGLDGLILSMHPTYLFVLSILGIAMWVDHWNNRLRWPFPFAFAWIAAVYAGNFLLVNTAWYNAIARAVGSLA